MCKCKVTDLLHTILVGSGEINVLQCEKTAAASVAGKMKRCCADCSESIFPGQHQMPVARRTSGITELIRGHAATKCLFFHLKPDSHFSKCAIMTNSYSALHRDSNHAARPTCVYVRVPECVCPCICRKEKEDGEYSTLPLFVRSGQVLSWMLQTFAVPGCSIYSTGYEGEDIVFISPRVSLCEKPLIVYYWHHLKKDVDLKCRLRFQTDVLEATKYSCRCLVLRASTLFLCFWLNI